uniref:Uncharacterized protein n=1 Tax=Oryza brachyantha TaxID=4533 RepID=J3MXU3_ORYBR
MASLDLHSHGTIISMYQASLHSSSSIYTLPYSYIPIVALAVVVASMRKILPN